MTSFVTLDLEKLTELVILVLMMQWRLEETVPPLQHKSARHRLSEYERGRVLLDFTSDSRSEQAWRESLNMANSSLRQDCNTNTQRSHDTAAASRKLRMAVQLQSPLAGGIYMRHRSGREPFGLYCQLFFKWQTLSSNREGERCIQSMLNRQVTDRDVIGKAVSNEPVKHSHRAIIRGLPLGLAPLTLGNTLSESPFSVAFTTPEILRLVYLWGLITETSCKGFSSIRNFSYQAWCKL